MLVGFERYIQLPNLTSFSDGNVLGGRVGEAAPFALYSEMDPEHNGDYDLAAWRDLGVGLDRESVEIPLRVEFDEVTMELRVWGPSDAPWPTLKVGVADGRGRLPSGAFYGGILRADLLGRSRGDFHEWNAPLQAGPLVDLPLDGTPIRVDPRRLGGRHSDET